MKILLIGQGGREHALAWKIAQSPAVHTVYVAPGNAGTALEAKVCNVTIDALDFKELAAFARQKQIALTIVGPEVPLSAGIVDYFQQQQLACFGPTKGAAALESSKAFSKAFMLRHHIPTAQALTTADYDTAVQHIQAQKKYPIVIKADGLAAGKGVVIAQNEEEAIITLDGMLRQNKLGKAGAQVVLEEFIVGEELSFIAICDGKVAIPLASSQDHKRRNDQDQGPNTGGMGAYSPAPCLTSELQRRIMTEIINPTLAGMTAEGKPFVGFLYAGLIIDKQGNPYTIEFNCRLGDPETQPLMMRLQTDLVNLCFAALKQTLATETIEWHSDVALGVILAASEYPQGSSHGVPITLPTIIPEHTKIFHAGTQQLGDTFVTAGGRILCVTARGADIATAQQRAYDMVKKVVWAGCHYRNDIGARALDCRSPA